MPLRERQEVQKVLRRLIHRQPLSDWRQRARTHPSSPSELNLRKPGRGEGENRGELQLAIHPDGSVLTYTKEHVHQSEAEVFTSGPGGPALLVGDATVALAICADATHPQHAASAAARGANVYAVGVMITGDGYARKAALLRNYAREHRMAVLMANYSGATGGWESAGKSTLWSEDGQLLAASTGAEEALIVGGKQNGVWNGIVLPLSLPPAAP